jgi:hypothetical protein
MTGAGRFNERDTTDHVGITAPGLHDLDIAGCQDLSNMTDADIAVL